MARGGKLSAVEVTKAKGPAVLHDGGGLYLRVSPAGAKSWVFRYQLAGKRHDMGIGPFPEIGLAEARERAQSRRRQRHDGIDPLKAREAERQSQRLLVARGRTFREVGEEFLDRNEPGWRNATHRQQWRSTLATYVYPVLGDLPVSAVDTGLVMQVLSPLWSTKTETANRVRGRIEAILDAARVNGYRDGENPARWRGHLDALLPRKSRLRRVKHLPALPYDELPGFFSRLRTRASTAAQALGFTILTSARTAEALNARWGEIDLAQRVWIIPAERMKAAKEHRVPLSDAAMAILEQMLPITLMRDGKPAPETPIFPGRRRALSLSRMVMIRLLQRMGHNGLTIHGFRSTFRDWAAERTGYPHEVVEMALAHAIQNRVEAAYRRGDLFQKRRQLMQEWARFCTTPATDGEVLPLRANR